MKYLAIYWKKAMNIEGRCSRRTFWMTVLINACIEGGFVGIGLILRILGTGANDDKTMIFGTALIFIGLIYSVCCSVPGISMGVRRLHDRNMVGWFMFLIMFPAVQIFILAMFILGPKDAGNRWGLTSD